MSARDVFVPGLPVTQGNKRHVGHGVMVESKNLKPWRAAMLLLVGAGLVTWRKRQRDELGRFSA